MIKKIIKEVIAFFLIQLYYISRKNQDGVLSIFFHNPSEKVFEDVLIWLVSKNYKFISTKDLNLFINNNVIQNEKQVCITFDDAWKDNLKLINLINNYRVPITIFVPTEAIIEGNYWFEYAGIKGQKQYSKINNKADFKKLPEHLFIEKVKLLKKNYSLERSCLTLNELKTLSKNKLITIGSHTVTHPILKMCSIEKQREELAESKKVLNQWLNLDIEFLAYPNGDFNQDTIEIAKQCGYKLGFSIILGNIDVKKVNPYIIPRNVIHDTGGHYENIAKALGLWRVFN